MIKGNGIYFHVDGVTKTSAKYLPPTFTEEVIILVASVCLSVYLSALCMLNRWTYEPIALCYSIPQTACESVCASVYVSVRCTDRQDRLFNPRSVKCEGIKLLHNQCIV